jgi:hypothetical protein
MSAPVEVGWIRVDVNLPRHPKSLLLSALLNIPKAYAYVQEVWMYCSNHARDGRIEKRLLPIVEQLVDWRGTPGALIAAAVEVGFADWDGDTLVVHKWKDRQGDHIAQAVKEIEIKREKRAQAKAERQAGAAAAAPQHSRGSAAAPHNETLRDATIIKATTPPTPSGGTRLLPLRHSRVTEALPRPHSKACRSWWTSPPPSPAGAR